MKKALSFLSLILCVCLAVSFAGCNDDPAPSGGDGTSITLNRYELTLDVGENFKLEAAVSGGGSVTWESSDAGVATVSADGTVTGVANGTARIYANVGDDRSECAVTVEEGLRGLPGLSLDLSTSTIYIGYTKTVTPVFKVGAEEKEMDASAMQWSSSNPAVATVTGGEVTGIAAGSATVSLAYTYEGETLSASVDVTVTELAFLTLGFGDGSTSLATPKTYSGAENTAGSSKKMVVTKIEMFAGEDEPDSEILDNSKVTFTSSDANVATVDASGAVQAKGVGTVTISAAYGSIAGDVELQVRTAMNCKRDFDMLALADALGKTEDWNSDAEYILTQNIDYNNALWIPIAAESTLCANPGVATGVQFESVLASGNYGLEYEAFARAGGINADNRSFNATIDGNGYSISNAKVMGDAYVDHSATATFKWNVFGNFGGTLTNIGFENFIVQQQSEVDPFYASKTETAYTTSGSTVLLSGGLRSGIAVASGFIAVNTGTIQDLYVDFDVPGGNAFTAMSGGSRTNAFIIDNRGGNIERVVVNWNWSGTRESYQTRLFELNSGTISGVIAVWPMATSGTFTLVRDGQTAAANSALFASESAYTAEELDLSGFTKWDVSGSGLPVLKGAARA